jgi:hypothetical protein
MMKNPYPTLLSLLAALALPLAARADTQRYRYEIDMKSGEESYAGELPSGNSTVGPWHEVERDDKGRLIRAASYRDSTKQAETIYHYTGDSTLYDTSESYAAGEHTGKSTYARDANGTITHIDRFTVEGVPTTHISRTEGSDGTDIVIAAVDGVVRLHYLSVFAENGALLSYKSIIGTGFYEYQMDTSTGQQQSRRKVDGGKQVLSTKYTYDGNGDKLREDVFDENGKPYAVFSYSDGLVVRRGYTFDDGSREQTDITYNEKHWSTEARLTVNGVFICTFTFDRLPDGTVKRTLALGPNGDLWAEYPDRLVNDITQNGQPVDRTDGIIHHAGNWW